MATEAKTPIVSKLTKHYKINDNLQQKIFLPSIQSAQNDKKDQKEPREGSAKKPQRGRSLSSKQNMLHFNQTVNENIYEKKNDNPPEPTHPSLNLNIQTQSGNINVLDLQYINDNFTSPKQNHKSIERPLSLRVDKSPVKKIKIPNTVNMKVLELWINDTIFEAESGGPQNQKTGEKKSALKQFNIDRKTLKTKGISMENIDRMYRCLFVYSFGFYEMLYSIFEHAQDQQVIIANIWKVYGILLEYCSRNNFVSTIMILEKEKNTLINQLESKINKKEKQIQEMENRDKLEWEKLQVELKQLERQREDTELAKQQIEDDFKQADQAFNEELALRLKFEHRINQVYSIHREVVGQHTRLMMDFNLVKEEKAKIQQEFTELQQRCTKLQAEKQSFIEDLRQKDVNLSHKSTEILNLYDKMKVIVKLADSYKDILEGKCVLIKDHERAIEDLTFKNSNLTTQLNFSSQNVLDNQQSIHDFIIEKDIQYNKIKEQQEQIDSMREKIHELENQILAQTRKNDIINEKVEELQGSIKQNLIIQTKMKQDNKQLGVDIDFQKKKNASLEADQASMQAAIQEIKIARNELEDQYLKIKIKLENTYSDYIAKSNLCKQQEIQLNEKHIINYKQGIELKSVTQHFTHEFEKFKSRDELFTRQIRESQAESINMINGTREMKQEHQKMCSEFDTKKKQCEDLKQLNRNLNIQNDLNLEQINTLKQIIETERNKKTELAAQLGQILIEREELTRQILTHSFISQEIKQNYEFNQIKLQDKHNFEVKKIRAERNIHQMVYEDVKSQLVRSQESQQEAIQNLQKLTIIHEQLLENKKLAENSVQKIQNQLIQLKINCEQKDQTLNILYLRQKQFSIFKENSQLKMIDLVNQNQKLNSNVKLINDSVATQKQICSHLRMEKNQLEKELDLVKKTSEINMDKQKQTFEQKNLELVQKIDDLEIVKIENQQRSIELNQKIEKLENWNRNFLQTQKISEKIKQIYESEEIQKSNNDNDSLGDKKQPDVKKQADAEKQADDKKQPQNDQAPRKMTLQPKKMIGKNSNLQEEKIDQNDSNSEYNQSRQSKSRNENEKMKAKNLTIYLIQQEQVIPTKPEPIPTQNSSQQTDNMPTLLTGINKIQSIKEIEINIQQEQAQQTSTDQFKVTNQDFKTKIDKQILTVDKQSQTDENQVIIMDQRQHDNQLNQNKFQKNYGQSPKQIQYSQKQLEQNKLIKNEQNQNQNSQNIISQNVQNAQNSNPSSITSKAELTLQKIKPQKKYEVFLSSDNNTLNKVLIVAQQDLEFTQMQLKSQQLIQQQTDHQFQNHEISKQLQNHESSKNQDQQDNQNQGWGQQQYNNKYKNNNEFKNQENNEQTQDNDILNQLKQLFNLIQNTRQQNSDQNKDTLNQSERSNSELNNNLITPSNQKQQSSGRKTFHPNSFNNDQDNNEISSNKKKIKIPPVQQTNPNAFSRQFQITSQYYGQKK